MSPSRKSALVIFARAPRPGAVKTRLLPAFTAQEACEIHLALLGDVVERSLRAAGSRAHPLLAWSERPDPGAAAPADLPAGLDEAVQPPGSLGERMALTVQERLRAGFAGVLILGSDAPTLPDDHLVAALDALGEGKVVLGPAEDGGYYLVGMSRLHPEIFRNVAWGTPEVLAVTRKRLRHSGIGFEELGAWHDVDTPADVGRLWKEMLRLKGRRPEALPRRSWSVLSRLAPGRVAG